MSKVELIELILEEENADVIEYLLEFVKLTIQKYGSLTEEDLPKPKSEYAMDMEFLIMDMIKDFRREDVMRCAFTFIHDLWKEVYSEQAKSDVAVG